MRPLRPLLLAAAFVVVGCKDTPPQGQPKAQAPDPHDPHDPHAGLHIDAGVPAPPIDWAACEAAVTKAEAADPAARPQILIDGCRVCGDWTPILRWNTPHTAGGPTRNEIEAAMLTCNAFCIGDAKLKFLGTLDNARGKSSRMPWKQLGLLCQERVSAVPDARFLDGAYFALDRIARAIGARGGELATRVAAIDIPLPPVGFVGTGPPLPVIKTGVSATSGELQITLLAGTISVGTVPRARLTPGGVKVDLGVDGYPGKTVTAGQLGATLKALRTSTNVQSVMILAPPITKVTDLYPVVKAASAVMPVYLAARAPESPEGWELPVAIDAQLPPKGAPSTGWMSDMTVQQLAEALARGPLL